MRTGWGLFVLISLPGDSDVLSSLRPTAREDFGNQKSNVPPITRPNWFWLESRKKGPMGGGMLSGIVNPWVFSRVEPLPGRLADSMLVLTIVS